MWVLLGLQKNEFFCSVKHKCYYVYIQLLLYLIFFKGSGVSEVTSVLYPFRHTTLLLFELMYELAFSFAKASYFALFLHKVEKRFFTALSVLHKQHDKYN